jgi:uncharacterized protein (DUF1684 family)
VSGADRLALLDWRRRVASLYADVRSATDPATGHALWVAGRDELLRHHPQSPVPVPARATFAGATVAPYDPAYRFEVALDAAPASTWDAETGTDGIVRFERIGRVVLGGLGSLDVWWLDAYGGGVFVPVRDALAGHQTYGGGRYVIDTVKGADLGSDGAHLVVDLNFAYNPSCAYDEAWACPLAPSGNRLDAPVPVGELASR